MSCYPKYWLYRVGRGPKTDESQGGPILLLLPDLADPDGLPIEHRYLAERIAFNSPGANGTIEWKTLPLTEETAASLERQGWLVAKYHGHGEPRLQSEKKLLAAVTARRDEVLSGKSSVYPLLSPFGDYMQAGLVRSFLRAGKTKKYRIEELPESELPFQGGVAKLLLMVESLERLRRELRGKGWRFKMNGVTWEPSEGGRRRRFPGDLIRRAYDSLAVQYEHSGRGQGIMAYLHEILRPQVGELTLKEIEAALKNHLRT